MIFSDEKLLRTPCDLVQANEIGHIVDLLQLELERSASLGRPGVGLAAPQIGIYKKIAIIRYDNFSLNLINPEIVLGTNLVTFKKEGCLSFPGIVEDTLRYSKISIKNNNELVDLSGYEAIIAQHESDHLFGVLLPDRAIIKPKLKSGPNDPCFCGSKLKRKKCHPK